jgi:hypothetical protein
MPSSSEIVEMKDKLRVLANEQRVRAELKRDLQIDNERKNASSYSAFTAAELAESDSGRFAKRIEVVGQKRETNYPTLPSSSPWSQPDPSGLEPPLGISVADPQHA